MALKLKDKFTVGDTVQVHPSHDVWVMGDRFGKVESVGRVWVHVRMFRSSKLRKFTSDYVSIEKPFIKSVSIINGKI